MNAVMNLYLDYRVLTDNYIYKCQITNRFTQMVQQLYMLGRVEYKGHEIRNNFE